MRKTILLLLTAFSLFSTVIAQTYSISGKIIDAKDNSPLIGVNIVLTHTSDSTLNKGATTDIDGNFLVTDVAKGDYNLEISYISYTTIKRKITVSDSMDLKTISMTQDSKLLKEVIVQDKQIRAQQLGDTVQYNANSFKTNKDATAEDLLGKMPGVTSDNGTVKVNGEQVKKILVDGKEFFGDDPNIALKNLPSEIIDKVQVFDKLSDQSAFTGFDDGNSTKTVNIITKKGKNNGTFGKIYGGYGGPGNRYTAGGNINIFKGDRRFSIIGMSNNVNQQNFNAQDLLGLTGGSGGGGGFGGRGGFSGGGGGPRGGGGGRGGDNTLNNFLVGQQNGIAMTHSIGINYGDVWGKNKKVKVTSSYFFNASKNTNDNNLSRNYISDADSGLVYNESSSTVTNNFNHRLNVRIEYNIDSNNSLIFTPRLSFQMNKSNSDVSANNNDVAGLISESQYNNSSKYSGVNFSNDILYQHKFKKKGRTFSTNFTTSFNNKNGSSSLYSLSDYISSGTSDLLNQYAPQHNKSYTFSGNIAYTEPAGKNGQVQINYSPSYTHSKSLKTTYNFDSATMDYTSLDTSLSNKFDNVYIYNRAGANYRYNKNKLNFMVGFNFQHAWLQSQQLYPSDFELRKNFYSFLPSFMLNYKFSKEKNLRLMYRASTNPPSISQLQDVINNTNPLQLSTGNPNLRQDYTHTLIFRYGQSNPTKATNLFAFLMGSYTEFSIANATFTPSSDSLLANDIVLARGSQLTKPVNISGAWNVRTFLTYGLPISKIKCNFNVNGGFTFARTPGQINSDKNFSNNYAFNAGFVLSSNISEKIDFTLAYNANYTIVKNTLQQSSNNNYFNHTASAKFNWQFWKGFVINTNVTNTLYAGVSSGYNTDYWLWNASLAYKFLKNENLEVKFSVSDILNQNKNVSRTVTETYIEDARYTALQRYYMGTITYTLRKFKGSSDDKKKPVDFMGTPSGSPVGQPPHYLPPPPGN